MPFAEGRYFFIRSRLSGMVLDVKGGSESAGTPVFMWPKKDEDNDNQLWYEDHPTGTVRSKMNEFCLELEDESTVVLNPYSPHAMGQKWMVGGDRIQMKANPWKVLDIIGNNCDEGADLCAWDLKGSLNQLWFFEYEPVKFFFIKTRMNGKVLDVKGVNCDPGAEVITWEKNDDAPENQLWYISRDGLIRSKLNGFVIDSSDEDTIKMYPYDPSSEQQGYCLSECKIARVDDQNIVLDVKGANQDDGAEIISWEVNGNDNQLWDLEYV